jgi:hypothetical protein
MITHYTAQRMAYQILRSVGGEMDSLSLDIKMVKVLSKYN